LFIVHFLCLPKENEPKEKAAVHLAFGFPALLAIDGTLKTHRLRRFKQFQRLIPSTAAMLGGVKWR